MVEADYTKMAYQLVSEYLNVAIPSEEFVEHYDGGNKVLRLDHGPVSTLTSVYDETLEETVDSDDYRLEDEMDSIIHKHGSWTSGYKRYKVTYTAGWDAEVDLPEIVWGAIVTIRDRLEAQVAEGSAKSSESLGDYSYQVSVANEVLFSFEYALDLYKRY